MSFFGGTLRKSFFRGLLVLIGGIIKLGIKNWKNLLLCSHLLEESRRVYFWCFLCLFRIHDYESEISYKQEAESNEYYFLNVHILFVNEEIIFERMFFPPASCSWASFFLSTVRATESPPGVCFFVFIVELVRILANSLLCFRLSVFGDSETTRTVRVFFSRGFLVAFAIKGKWKNNYLILKMSLRGVFRFLYPLSWFSMTQSLSHVLYFL